MCGEAAAWRGKEGEDEAGRGEMTAAVDGGGEAARGRAVTEEAASVRRLRARRRATWRAGLAFVRCSEKIAGAPFTFGCAPTTYWLELECILTVSLNVPQDFSRITLTTEV